MDYVIHSLGIPFNGETFKQKSIGGSESAAYYQAKELARRGHRVLVFTTEVAEGTFDRVQYCWAGEVTEQHPLGERFHQYAEHTPHDVLIIQRHPLGFHRDYASKINILQLHDLALHRSTRVINDGLARVTFVTVVSEFHKKQVCEVYGINPERVKVVRNGVDTELYLNAQRNQMVGSEVGFRMLYQSRPERGLEHLVRPGGIMAKLAESGSGAQLFICGYDNTTEQMRGYYAQLENWARQLPNVHGIGALTKEELAGVQKTCHLLIYPTEFEEVSCITAMEAMHAQLPMLSSACGALPETCEDAGVILLPLKDGQADEQAFVDEVLRMERGMTDLDELRTKQLHAKRTRTWTYAVNELEEHVRCEFDAVTTQQRYVHFMEHSDIVALERFGSYPVEESQIDRIMQTVGRELDAMYDFSRPGGDVLKHYAQWEEVSIREKGGDDAIIANLDNITGTTRYQGIRHFVHEAVQGGAKRILEYGCSYGHIVIPLAQEFPGVEFVGVDFHARSVDIATKAAAARGVTNVSFVAGDLPDLPDLGEFDAVVAAEVLEHIRDDRAALAAWFDSLTSRGALILTTPFGRWEWMGHDNWRKGREHLHHYAREDLTRLLESKHQDVQILCAPAGTDDAHLPIGSWVTRVKLHGDAYSLNELDYTKRARRVLPRQTVSLCMIVRNGEATLRKALLSAIEYVDEVIVGIDETTDDATKVTLNRVREQYPYKAIHSFSVESPLTIGFDAARNQTLDYACGDWILWMDADEELVGAHNLHRLLRPSAYNAYGIAQVHYSAQPAQVLRTDYPARLFRNRRGVRFYGVVHEHPEESPGKAIQHTSIVHDVQFSHYGYVDEVTRRRRFARNYPLLQRDIAAHPDRELNKYLLLRDIAQTIGFERERGHFSPDQFERAREGCTLFERIVEGDNLRFMIDALEYYSVCSATLGVGFDAQVHVQAGRRDVPSLAFAVDAKGHFHNRRVYQTLVNKLTQESVKHYESRYL